jgi:phosphate acetyltransferase
MDTTKPLLQKILKKAASNVKHIVLPEGDDPRMIAAAQIATEMKLAKITMLGNADKITSALKAAGANLTEIKVIDPVKSEKLQAYAEQFFNLRKDKGVTEAKALETVKDVMYFGNMMLKGGDCDGLVSGAVHSTPDTVRPALQIVKAAPGLKTVSSMFFMSKGEQTLLFSDCGLNEYPTPEQLVDIVLSTVKTGFQFDFQPRVAVLSYSTKGSAVSEKTKMMAGVALAAREKLDQIYGVGKVPVDGELQFDAAYVPAIAAKKAPGSPVEGKANVFIFPDLGAGNLAYKITERLGGYDAYGPILQGLSKPVNDLSRGCSADDIVATIAITSIQAM